MIKYICDKCGENIRDGELRNVGWSWSHIDCKTAPGEAQICKGCLVEVNAEMQKQIPSLRILKDA